jgi:RNA polymerase sigma-70 factor (ECF subfamily)
VERPVERAEGHDEAQQERVVVGAMSHVRARGPGHVAGPAGVILFVMDDVHDTEWLAVRFDESRPRLQGLAYRMLGSHAEAEDAVQEAWLRLRRTDPAGIENVGGLLTTVVGRVCLDRLRARRARPEVPVDELPAAAEDPSADPAHEALLADSLGAALMLVLDRLGPAERVAFVLHDVFGIPFDEIGAVLDRSPAATRQLASRARRRVQGSGPTEDLDLVVQRELVEAFLRAARGGDFEALMRVLHPDVVLVPDAAALQMGSLRELRGAPAVAEALSGGAQGARMAVVDGVTAFVWAPGGQVRGIVRFTVTDGLVVAIDVAGDPARVAAADIVLLDG